VKNNNNLLEVPNINSKDAKLKKLIYDVDESLFNEDNYSYEKFEHLCVCSGGTTSSCAKNGFTTLDLRKNHNNIHLDKKTNLVTIGGGVIMGDLVNHLQKHNRSFPIGLSKLPGAGYILTGGVSPLSRAYGLAIDNIESIKGFLGNGTFISLKKNQINPDEQLIWEAIKGAAPFFSIITEIELKTIQSNPIKVIEGFVNLNELSEIIKLSEEFPENISLQWIYAQKIYVYIFAELNNLEDKRTEEYLMLLDKFPALEKQFHENFNKIKKNRNFPFKYQVEPDDIADVISKITGIPISKVVSNERKKLVNLETELSEKVIGQEKAIEAVSAAIRRARVGMKSPKRPIGSFLFMGPTGVGKTELAKSLATVLFDEEDALLRLDMSEYMEKNAVARLLGAPPGYVGYEEGGQLTEAVRRKPYSVILLDEIEKAHTEVFNILLQVLDEGRLTDSQGRTVDFKNTVIIMTSNLAGKSILEYSQKISKSEGKFEKDQQTLDDSISNALSSIFRPEFLNRIDEVVKFDPLSIDELQKIIILQTEELKNLLLEQKINITIDKKVINKIANDSYEPEYGARPLSRELRRQIENPLAIKLLEDNFKNKKNITIKLNPAKKDEIVFKPS